MLNYAQLVKVVHKPVISEQKWKEIEDLKMKKSVKRSSMYSAF